MTIEIHIKGLANSLFREFKSEDLNFCLNKIGVLHSHETLFYYQDITPWRRGGAETFIAVASVTVARGAIKFIAKALVSMATQPDIQLKNWSARRTTIQSIGIKTPQLFSELNAVIYEEFIDSDFSLTHNLSKSILEQLAFIAAKLDSNGFTTISFINDLRLKNETLYYVDFGSDLGEPSNVVKNSAFKVLTSKLTIDQLAIVLPIYNSLIQDKISHL